MRKSFLIFFVILFFVVNVFAQTKSSGQTAKNTNTTTSKSSKGDTSLSQSLKDFKNLFEKKKQPGIVISVTGIEYEDDNLTLLKENIKKIKGVKSVSTIYKSGTAKLEIEYKGKPTDLWDELPKDSRALFKMVDAADSTMSVEYKKK